MTDGREQGEGFRWNLTPGAAPDPNPESAPASPPPSAADVPTEPTPAAKPEVDDWDVPTAASPVISRSVFPLPPPAGSPGLLPPQYPPALDTSLEGVTEVLGAHPVGLETPVDEGLGTSDIDVLFGDAKFVDYSEPQVPAPTPTTVLPPPYASQANVAQRSVLPAATASPPVPSRPPVSSSPLPSLAPSPPGALALYEGPKAVAAHAMPRTQKILIGVAGGLVAALALVALFLLGSRIGTTTAADAAATQPPTAAQTTPATEPPVVTVGPVAVGDHSWDELLGGECLTSYESPWQQTYTVVECAQDHPAQMLAKGVLADTGDVAYPGTADLQARTTLACTATTVVDFAAARAFSDIEVAVSFPASAERWDAGDRTYSCFARRSGGGDLTGSIAVPAV